MAQIAGNVMSVQDAWQITKLVRVVVVTCAIGLVGGAVGWMGGCDEEADSVEGNAVVRIAGEAFDLEVVTDPMVQYKGLGGREYIAPDGGMVFVFPRADIRQFVMRDCLVPIDILYVDGNGRVLTMHEMPIEPREDGESDAAYEARLTRYSSRFPVQFVIEVVGGTIDRLGIEEGDKVKMNVAALKEGLR